MWIWIHMDMCDTIAAMLVLARCPGALHQRITYSHTNTMSLSGVLQRLRHALLLIIFLPLTLSSCVFPDFMQSVGNTRDWRGQIKSQYKEFMFSLTIDNNQMNVIPIDPSVIRYTRICVQALSDNKFITAHDQSRQRSQRFVCVQFIRRSDNVVQLMESEIVRSMAGVCDLHLHLDPWIFVDKNSVLDNSRPCPLIGGYSIKLFDKEYRMDLCGAYKDHVWMETECVAGSGLYFNFRYTRCVPNIFMSSQQRTMCLANWTEGSNAFMLIRHDTQPYMWLMRYPADQKHLTSFVAYLMKDLYAATGTHITEIDTYVQMDMVRDIPHPVSSLCTDEFEGCDYYSDPCTKGGETALTCARTCGVCNETRPVVCSFDDTWHGDWIDPTHGDKVAATFESQILSIYYNRLHQKFHCIRWDEPHSGTTTKYTTYKMLVTEFDNGCRPQYSCAKIIHRDSSSVMFLQLSSERHWPITKRVTDQINCNNFDYEGDTNTLIPNRYRSKHYRLLYAESLDTGTTCNMPLGDVKNYTVTLSDNTRCYGWLRASTSGSSVSVRISECSKDSSVFKQIPREHTCIESSRLFTSDLLVVSRTDEEPYQLYCWLFPRRTQEVFYLVESAHCNDNTKRRISRGHLQPLAAFSSVPLTTTSQAPESTTYTYVFHTTQRPILDTINSRENSKSGEHSVLDRISSFVNNDSVSSRDNSSSSMNSPNNPASYASPIVIVAAIMFFVVYQIPCMCKNS